MKRISSPFPAFCHEYLKIKTFGVTILGKRNLKCNRFMSQDPNPAKNMDIHGMCMVIISGKSGRGEKLELGDSGWDPKMQEELKTHSSLCSGNVQIMQDGSLDFSKFPSCNCKFWFCCQFCSCSAAVECKDDIFSKECCKKKKKERVGTAIPPKNQLCSQI